MTSLSKYFPAGLIISFVTLSLINCGGSGGSNGAASSGTVTLQIADAPVDEASAVWIQFRGLEIHGANGTTYTFNYCADPATGKTTVSSASCTQAAPKKLNLLTLTNGVTDLLLENQTLPAGRYEWIRLLVDAESNVRDSYIEINGAEYELNIPSGAESGLKLNRGFDVSANGNAAFTIDFDLRKSVRKPGSSNEYKLRPTLRIVDNSNLGTITGSAIPTLVSTNCNAAIYVFEGQNVIPDDMDDLAAEPVTVATIALDSATGEYTYRASFLQTGDYTLALTCNANQDDPDTDDSLNFIVTANVSVSASQNTRYNF